ncbi:MAG TPA: hypothetical protein PKH77_02230 [Anaerolineae bacterium]|nr:hypothetical protein [Anaerolineae bacterium]
MSDSTVPQESNPPAPSAWGVALESVRCPHCDWRYFAPPDKADIRCPHCFQADLTPLGEAAAQLPYRLPPEQWLPFAVDAATLNLSVETFAGGIPYAPRDLNGDALRARVQPLYLPLWLVDGNVTAEWSAEVGFNYQVVSHRERYADGGGWRTEEIHKDQVRWESRVGRLERHYDNVVAPALEDHPALERALGTYPLTNVRPYAANALSDALVRLPDRAPSAAWPDATPNFQAAAAEECRQAAQSDHIQKFRWSPKYTQTNWTLLLLPVYASYYLDDESAPQPVLINGLTGKITGARRASMQRAQRAALITAIVAVVLFALGLLLGILGIAAPPLLVFGILLAIVAFGGGAVGALLPIVRASRFNRKQEVEGR